MVASLGTSVYAACPTSPPTQYVIPVTRSCAFFSIWPLSILIHALRKPLSHSPLVDCITPSQRPLRTPQTVPAHIAKAFTKAQEAVALRKPYEDAVAPDRPADANLLAAYMSYVRLEQAQGDPARVQCVYERAIAAFPVTHELWAQYGRYLEVHLKAVPALASRAYGRAIRNCYWVGSLWARAMRAAARAVRSADGAGGGGGAALDAALREQAALYQRALQAGLQVGLWVGARMGLEPRSPVVLHIGGGG